MFKISHTTSLVYLLLSFALTGCGDSGTDDDTTTVPVGEAVASVLNAEASPASVSLSWNDTGATSYNLYYYTVPDCDIVNYISCPGGTMLANVTSPYTASALTNGQNYWFTLESVTNGNNATSNQASARPDQIITNGRVRAIAHDVNGTAYLGGDFTQAGMNTGHGVPLDTTTGRPGAFPVVDAVVFASASDGAGGYYIGGNFTTVGGQGHARLAHILADGTVDSWSPVVDNTVFAIAVINDTVYVGGDFTTIDNGAGTLTRNRLAAFDIDGALKNWNPTADNTVKAITVSGTTVYVGGSFTSIDTGAGAQTRNRLAAFDSDGRLNSWDPSANNTINALTNLGGTIYAGGLFTTIDDGGGTQTRNRLAAIDTDGTLNTSWKPSANNMVFTLTASDSMVYVGGFFTTIDDGSGVQTRNRLAAIGPDGLLNTVWKPDVDNFVYTLAFLNDTVYAGGGFTTLDDGSGVQVRNNLAAINTDGTLSDWNPSPNDAVLSLEASDTTVYVGGPFRFTNSAQRNYLVAINSDGTLGNWNPDANKRVYSLAVSDGMVYAGGDFTLVSGETRNYLAAIDTDGVLGSWNPNTDSSVDALAVSNNVVYAGGGFTTVNGVTRNHLAAIGTDGVLSTIWAPDADSGVNALSVSANMVYVGGYFDSIDGQVRNHLAAIATDGTLSATWKPVVNRFSVLSLIVSGSTVYVGGDFTYIETKERRHLAAIGTDGILSSWNPAADNIVLALAVFNNTVYAGGIFTTIDGVARNNLAAIGTDGILSSSLNSGANDFVRALAISENKVYVGGDFKTVNDEFRPHISILVP